MRLLITGANGQLGKAMTQTLAHRHDMVGLSHGDLDITSAAAVVDAVQRTRPEAIINCAAYNDVDGAEDDALTALAANAFGVLSLARAARDTGARFVHYSSDFVFDGRTTAPYGETDTPNPESVYAVSKLLGEWFAAEAPRHYVLRVESLFGGGALDGGIRRPRGSSLDRIVDALLEGREVRAFADRTVSPSYVDDVARATEALLTRDAPHGLYHCVNSGHATWLEVAETAAAFLAISSTITSTRLADVPLRARRPAFCALSNAKLTALGVEMPSWQDALRRYLERRGS